jgi:hypothetical protein
MRSFTEQLQKSTDASAPDNLVLPAVACVVVDKHGVYEPFHPKQGF